MPRALRFFLIASAVLTAACILTELFCIFILHLAPEVYRQPLFVGFSFMDFECYHQCFVDLHTAAFFGPGHTWPWAYPAPMAALFAPFYRLPGDPLNSYLASIAAGVLALAVLFTRALICRGLTRRHAVLTTAMLTVLSYPLVFTFERANAELFVFFVLALGLWAFVAPATRNHPWCAAILFGVAGSMKLFPLIFLALFLSRRQYRAFALGLLTAALATLVSLWWLGPTVLTAWRGIRTGGRIFRQAFLLHARPVEYGYDHSLFGFYRRFFPLPAPQLLSPILTIYLLAAALTGLTLYWFFVRKLPLLNQVLALTVAAILLPPASFDYTLIHLYLPLALFLLNIAARPACPTHGLPPILLSLALLLAPESELIWHGVRVAAQFKCLVLLVLFVQALLYPQPSPYDPIPAT